eukprot:jgi/Mesvir1/28435/Mv15858-RA.2
MIATSSRFCQDFVSQKLATRRPFVDVCCGRGRRFNNQRQAGRWPLLRGRRHAWATNACLGNRIKPKHTSELRLLQWIIVSKVARFPQFNTRMTHMDLIHGPMHNSFAAARRARKHSVHKKRSAQKMALSSTQPRLPPQPCKHRPIISPENPANCIFFPSTNSNMQAERDNSASPPVPDDIDCAPNRGDLAAAVSFCASQGVVSVCGKRVTASLRSVEDSASCSFVTDVGTRDGSGDIPGYALVSVRGRRASMEDAVVAVPAFCGGDSSLHLFGVFDGHGGSKAAEFCAHRLHAAIAHTAERFAAEVGQPRVDSAHVAAALVPSFVSVDALYCRLLASRYSPRSLELLLKAEERSPSGSPPTPCGSPDQVSLRGISPLDWSSSEPLPLAPCALPGGEALACVAGLSPEPMDSSRSSTPTTDASGDGSSGGSPRVGYDEVNGLGDLTGKEAEGRKEAVGRRAQQGNVHPLRSLALPTSPFEEPSPQLKQPQEQPTQPASHSRFPFQQTDDIKKRDHGVAEDQPGEPKLHRPTPCRPPFASGCHGTTANVAIVGPRQLIVANCGDSRAVLCRSGTAVPLSLDHKPDRADEAARIAAAGGHVLYFNGYRVLGVLAMSRAIGDVSLKPYVIPEPEVTVVDREEGDEFLILATDGLWDVVSNQEACDLARSKGGCGAWAWKNQEWRSLGSLNVSRSVGLGFALTGGRGGGTSAGNEVGPQSTSG